MNPVTLDTVETTTPGLTPWQPLRSGHPVVDEQVPGSLLGRSVQLRFAKKGHGITADSHALVLANARDGVVLHAHTRGKSDEHVRGMGLQHPRNREAARNVRIKKVDGPAKLAKLVYKGIATSMKKGTALPRLLVVDSVNELGQTSGDIGPNLELLRAIAEYDLDRIFELTGVSYEDVTDEVQPDLTGTCMAVVGYVTRYDDLTCRWGRTDTLPHLDDIAEVWHTRADSVVVLEKYEDEGLSLPGENARITFLKRTFVSAEKPILYVPMHYGNEDGGRPTWNAVETVA